MSVVSRENVRTVLSARLGRELTPELAAEIEMLLAARSADVPEDKFLLYCMKGNRDAVCFVVDVIKAADVWDNLVDGDKPVTPADVNNLCKNLLFKIQNNPFFSQNVSVLLPIMQVSILNWQIANTMSREDPESRIQSHVLRYAPIDLIVASAAIIGGDDWAVEVGPRIRRYHMRDTLLNYLQELAQRDYDAETEEYLKHNVRVFQSNLLAESERLHVAALLQRISPKDGAVIGDFGCGIGEVSRLMREMNPSLNFVMVTNSKAQLELLPNGNGFTQVFGDFSKALLQDASLDVAMFNQSISYTNIFESAARACNALRQGGVIAIYDFVATSQVDCVWTHWGYVTIPEQVWRGALTKAGFVDITFEYPETNDSKYAEFVRNSKLMRNLHGGTYSRSRCVFVKARKP